VIHVAVDVADEHGTFCPYAENLIHIDVSGPAKIIGIDNGDPLDLSDYKTNVRKAFRGKVMVWIQATADSGAIIVKASSGDLKNEEIVIQSN
jgi:beta-galactosidase